MYNTILNDSWGKNSIWSNTQFPDTRFPTTKSLTWAVIRRTWLYSEPIYSSLFFYLLQHCRRLHQRTTSFQTCHWACRRAPWLPFPSRSRCRTCRFRPSCQRRSWLRRTWILGRRPGCRCQQRQRPCLLEDARTLPQGCRKDCIQRTIQERWWPLQHPRTFWSWEGLDQEVRKPIHCPSSPSWLRHWQHQQRTLPLNCRFRFLWSKSFVSFARD